MFGKTSLNSRLQQICILTQGNAPAHTALPVLDFLAKNKITVVSHHPYSPDLMLYEFFIFPELDMPLKGRGLNNITLIQEKLHGVFAEFQAVHSQSALKNGAIVGVAVQTPEDTTSNGTTALVRRWMLLVLLIVMMMRNKFSVGTFGRAM